MASTHVCCASETSALARTPRLSLVHVVTALGASLLLCAGCVDLSMEKCGVSPDPINQNEPGTARVRTSHYRAVLADASEAAGRVLPYALMSAYAYHLGEGCADPGNTREVTTTSRRAVGDDALELWLRATAGRGTWVRHPELAITDSNGHMECEDDEGLAYHVWERDDHDRKIVVVAFRGTSGDGDWKYGNLWWFTRFSHPDNQYTRARAHMARIIEHFQQISDQQHLKRPRFISTGHSLGGGLAQHTLYAFSEQVEQAVVFDPSSVTAFADVDRDKQVQGCACELPNLLSEDIHIEPEPRILRVYQTYEILSDLRLFHKLFFAPERHVMELRFPFEAPHEQVARHNMKQLAANLRESAAKGSNLVYGKGAEWLRARDDQTCTNALRQRQATSCRIRVDEGAKACPG